MNTYKTPKHFVLLRKCPQARLFLLKCSANMHVICSNGVPSSRTRLRQRTAHTETKTSYLSCKHLNTKCP